ncbi:TetR/AcrR family transcriptional regulator [Wenjunlia tyrosinilytica]|uniref:TetR family transcriptional regulator n=1 Tax=Wenjunlia tyrosinilytica TaxID=1544741 RepID=A0A917ZGH8_9ACTN|nr:TetR/AcrR family transcriptional regulator [Wenjunlia tyrosinilytica]GGO82641.1 TetR family transcriptional regulator [Wenjunlia tyrosinilytica]
MSVDREHMLREAAALLTRRATASMDEIAKAAGISRATLHRHFPGRDALVRALGELGIRRMNEAMDAARLEEGDAVRALRRLVDAAMPEAGFLAFLYSENQLYDDAELKAGWDASDERVAALFRRGQEQGVFRIDLPAVWLTEAYTALIAGCGWAVEDGRIARRDSAHLVTETLLGGALRRQS